jgi:hypothetical protein
MKLSIFPSYGAMNSVPVFAAFSRGAEKLGHTVVEHDLSADVFVIWSVLWHGRMQKNQEIWNYAKMHGKQILILEVGGLRRGASWRVGLGHINNLGKFGNEKNLDLQRSKKFGISLTDWRKTGDHILICGQHSKSEQWMQRPTPDVWLKNLVESIKIHTDRKIIFRPHPRDFDWCQKIENFGISMKIPQKIPGTYDDFNHSDDFANAWCVVNPSSNTGMLAAISGIPVFCDHDSLAYPVSTKNFEKIETPDTPDRSTWLEKICHTEWTISEIEDGIPLARIFN